MSGYGRGSRLAGRDAGKLAIICYRCTNPKCQIIHEARKTNGIEGAKPAQCRGCGLMQFDRFDSKGECERYCMLEMLERRGMLYELRRQVKVPLLTVSQSGDIVQFGNYVADFTYKNSEGKKIIEDFKPSGGTDPLFNLKRKCLEANGLEIKVTTSRDT